MENVEFENELSNKRVLYGKFESSSTRPGLVSFLMKKNIVKTEGQANIILLGVVIVCAVLAYIFIKSSGQVGNITAEQVIESAKRIQ